MTDHQVVSREEWAAARDALLAREKEHTRRGDELARERRELPWVRVEKEYRFDTDDGTRTLADLFDGRSQLLVYHFMFGPSYEAGCPTCSSMADAIDGLLPHLHARDVTFLFVSQAPLEKLQATSAAWAGAFRGFPRRAPTSTSTLATRARRTRPARPWRRWRASCRRSPRTTPVQRARTSSDTSLSSLDSARTSA